MSFVGDPVYMYGIPSTISIKINSNSLPLFFLFIVMITNVKIVGTSCTTNPFKDKFQSKY